MANFKDSPHFAVHDDYYTPFSAWQQIDHILPKDKVILEAFMLDADYSKSPEYLIKLGCDVSYDKRYNFIEDTHQLGHPQQEYDMVVSNPPYSKELKMGALKKLHTNDKPFIIILNSNILYTNYLRDIFGEDMKHLQVIHPRGKINFDKFENGELKATKNCSFYAIYLCYKMDIANEDLWLK
jgi:hypothetical protein